MKQVWQTIEQFHMLEQQDRVLLGVSGGPDSVALLHILYQCREQYQLQLFVVHVDHQLRPEAAEEARYVQQLAQQMKLPFCLFSVDVAAYAAEHSMSLEQAGHAVRFSCFREAAQQWQITKLALGHHRNDRAESVLLHLVQGCGLEGLAAMPPKEGWLIRPLAQVSKQQILDYCQQQGWRYYIDRTNLETSCLRNKIRLELLPLLRQYNSKIEEALLRLQEISSTDDAYLRQCTQQLWQTWGTQTAEAVFFPAEQLQKQHKALQRRLLRFMYETLTGSGADLTFEQTEQMLKLAQQQRGSQQYDLPGGIRFVRQYQQLCLKRQQPIQQGYRAWWSLREPFALIQCSGRLEAAFVESEEAANRLLAEQTKEKNFYLQVLVDADKLAEMVEVRSRQPGDRVQPLGMQGHKKLKAFLIDKKVPAAERNRLPLVVSDGEIIWIPGYFLADGVKITKETKRYCLLQYRDCSSES